MQFRGGPVAWKGWICRIKPRFLSHKTATATKLQQRKPMTDKGIERKMGVAAVGNTVNKTMAGRFPAGRARPEQENELRRGPVWPVGWVHAHASVRRLRDRPMK